MPGADKAVKCKEDGVTRYVAGYTVFFLCGELFWKLRGASYLLHHLPDFLLVRKAHQSHRCEIDVNLHRFSSVLLFRIVYLNAPDQLVDDRRRHLFHVGKLPQPL